MGIKLMIIVEISIHLLLMRFFFGNIGKINEKVIYEYMVIEWNMNGHVMKYTSSTTIKSWG